MNSKTVYSNKNDNNIFKRLRIGKNLSQSEIASKLNVTQSAISKWESGVATPDPYTLKKIAELYHVTIDYILGKTDLPVELNTLKWDDNVRPIDLKNEVDFGKIPILGSIAAGNPKEAIEENNIDNWILTDMRALGSGLHFGLEVEGTSMEPRIYEGDIAIIEACDWVNSGQVAAVRVNGEETTLKKVKFEQDGMWLIGFNPSFNPIFYTARECAELPVTVIGRLVQVIQKY